MKSRINEINQFIKSIAGSSENLYHFELDVWFSVYSGHFNKNEYRKETNHDQNIEGTKAN